jgi:glycosyltransferase involved in cell wall biosynthesis
LSKLPVVTVDMGGAREIVDTSCGILVPQNDSSTLARALGTLVGDRSVRARLSEAAPLRARRLCDPLPRLADLRTILAEVAQDNATSEYADHSSDGYQ